MPARKPVTSDSLLNLAVDAAAGVSKRGLMKKYPDASERMIRIVMQSGLGIDEFRDAFSKQLQAIAGEGLLELQLAIRERRISPNSLALAVGILMDKATGLDGRAAIQNAAVNVQVNFNGPSPKAALLAELAGLSPALLVKSGDTLESITDALPAGRHSPLV